MSTANVYESEGEYFLVLNEETGIPIKRKKYSDSGYVKHWINSINLYPELGKSTFKLVHITNTKYRMDKISND